MTQRYTDEEISTMNQEADTQLQANLSSKRQAAKSQVAYHRPPVTALSKIKSEVIKGQATSHKPQGTETATSHKAPGGVPMNQRGLYAHVVTRYPQIFKALYDGLNSKNEATKIRAAGILLNKILPDLKAVEVGGEVDANGNRQAVQLFINTGGGFVPAIIQTDAPSAGSVTAKQQEVQDVSVAQTSTEDNDSNLRDDKTGTS